MQLFDSLTLNIILLVYELQVLNDLLSKLKSNLELIEIIQINLLLFNYLKWFILIDPSINYNKHLILLKQLWESFNIFSNKIIIHSLNVKENFSFMKYTHIIFWRNSHIIKIER